MADNNIIRSSYSFCTEKSYQSLLIDYAAGTLCTPLSCVVAAHLTLSPESRAHVEEIEKIGGSLLEEFCEPVPMTHNCLEHVLAKLTPRCNNKKNNKDISSEETHKIGGVDVPASLLKLIDCPFKKRQWKKISDGIEIYPLQKNWYMNFVLMRFAPSAHAKTHTHKGIEITLVLDGSFSDESGDYQRGEMIVMDENSQHTPTANANTGCICLSARSNPYRKLKTLACWAQNFKKEIAKSLFRPYQT